MTTRRNRSAHRLARQSTALALAAPQVIALRVARMAAHGMAPGVRDRQELARMGTEKLVAFTASWQAMAFEVMRVQQSLWLAYARSFAQPLPLGPAALTAAATRAQAAGLAVLSAGMAPVHRRAVANARRLAGTRRR
jgi:hypothetical protein